MASLPVKVTARGAPASVCNDCGSATSGLIRLITRLVGVSVCVAVGKCTMAWLATAAPLGRSDRTRTL